MSFLDFALRMHSYWFLGLFTFWTVWNSPYKELLNFNKSKILKFTLFIIAVSAFRFFMIKNLIQYNINTKMFEAAKILPLGGTLFTWWEDLAFTMPLILLKSFSENRNLLKPFYYIALIITILSFASGHIYQGLFSAAFISLYIPFGVIFGRKNGLGTLMTCHVLYDFFTLLTVKIALSLYGM